MKMPNVREYIERNEIDLYEQNLKVYIEEQEENAFKDGYSDGYDDGYKQGLDDV
jgi:flagellar biosynthesis/type III secretory pathway protein FliH